MRHAFLIMAHSNFSVLKSLISQIDAENHDIYIHINQKVKTFPMNEIIACAKKSKITFVDRKVVKYCDYTMMNAVKSLMKTASLTYHDYYHMISGADMMLKSNVEFDEFFEEKYGCEFVGFEANYDEDSVHYRNYFVALHRTKYHYVNVAFIRIRRFLISLQKKLGLKVKGLENYEVKKGYDWYSVTHNAVIYLLENEHIFKKAFYRAFCPTENFVQTLLWNSEFRDKIYKLESDDTCEQCLRYIDWQRGRPYVFRYDDKELLDKSKAMFARKFDENLDMEIVNYLKEKTLNNVEVE